MNKTFIYTLAGTLLLCCNAHLYARVAEENTIYTQQRLIRGSTTIPGKYPNHSGTVQQRLSHRLQHKDCKIVRKLVAGNSTHYRQHTEQQLSFNAIARLQRGIALLRQQLT